MKRLYTLIVPCVLALLIGCSKDFSYEGGRDPLATTPPPGGSDTLVAVDPPEEEQPPIVDPPAPILSDLERMQALLLSGKFVPTAFYSDIPIDYITHDAEVRQETDLWAYMAEWLIDDVDEFTETEIHITQNSILHETITDPVVTRSYSIEETEDGLNFVFLDYLYNPLTYRVHEIGDTYFILSIEGPQGSTLFSRFEILQ